MEDLVCEIENMYGRMFVENWVGTIFLPECGTMSLFLFRFLCKDDYLSA